MGKLRIIKTCCVCMHNYVDRETACRDAIDSDIDVYMGMSNCKKYICPECKDELIKVKGSIGKPWRKKC